MSCRAEVAPRSRAKIDWICSVVLTMLGGTGAVVGAARPLGVAGTAVRARDSGRACSSANSWARRSSLRASAAWDGSRCEGVTITIWIAAALLVQPAHTTFNESDRFPAVTFPA